MIVQSVNIMRSHTGNQCNDFRSGIERENEEIVELPLSIKF